MTSSDVISTIDTSTSCFTICALRIGESYEAFGMVGLVLIAILKIQVWKMLATLNQLLLHTITTTK